MAGRLANEFSWSFSRHSTFTECQKKYWYSYYGSWEGWPKTPYDSRRSIDPLAQHLYMLKQIKQVAMYVGTCVHGAIEGCLKQKTKKLPSLQELIATATTKFHQGITESRQEKWRESPKKYANLFEYYFRKNEEPFSSEMIANAEEKITRCLTNWYESAVVKMAFDTRANWISAEKLDSFVLDRYKIIVVVDFALRWQGSTGDVFILFDWKTGAESEKTEEQLYSYALYANRVLGAPFERIVLSPFYLAANKYMKLGYQQERPLEQARLEKVEAEIKESCGAMAAFLPTLSPSPGSLPPDPRQFAYTTERRRCLSCPFQEVCQKAAYAPLSQEELTQLIQPASLNLK